MQTFYDLVQEVAPWAEKNFGVGNPQHALLGALEEIGEFVHAFLKMQQGIRGSKDQHLANMHDAIGDTMVYLADFWRRGVWGDQPSLGLVDFVELQRGAQPLGTMDMHIFNAAKNLSALYEEFDSDGIFLLSHLVAVIDDLASLCTLLGVSLADCVQAAWDEVKGRDWTRYKATGLPLEMTSGTQYISGLPLPSNISEIS